MLNGLLLILSAQLFGEVVTRTLGAPLPGPVLGLIVMVVAMSLWPPLADMLRTAGQALIAHLSLLFVPAGVGVVGHIATLDGHTIALLAAVVGSTVIAIAVGALTFVFVARLVGSQDA